MARLFDDASNEYLEINQAVAGIPLAMVCRFNTNDLDNHQCLMHIGKAGDDVNAFYLLLNTTSDQLAATTRGAAGPETAFATSSYSANTWQHACGIWVVADDRRAFLNGTNKGTDNNSTIPALAFNVTGIGRLNIVTPTFYMSGMIAEAAIYDLSAFPGGTDSDKADYFEANILPHLAAGEPPGDYTTGLIAYWPLRDDDDDYADAFDLTPYNTPSWTTHPTIIHLLDGTISSQSALAGYIKSVEMLNGQIAAQAALTAKLRDLTSLSGSLVAQSSLTGNLQWLQPLAGSIGAQSSGLLANLQIIYVSITPAMHKDLIDPYSGGAWLWLVEIVIPGQTIQRIARNTEDVVYGGINFPKGNFEPPKQSLSGDGSVPTVVLRVAQDPDRVLENIINATKGGTNGTVKLIRTCEKFLDIPVAELEADFDILSIGSNVEWIIFSLGIPNLLIQRIPLWLYSSKVCPYATPSLFKGVRCQYTGTDPTCTGLLEDCNTKGNIGHWGAEVGLDPNAVRV